MAAEDPTTELRTCRWCKLTKHLSEVPLVRGKYFRKCKKCTVITNLAWSANNRERSREIKRKFVLNHPEEDRTSKRKHYDANRDRIIRREVERKQKNKDHINAMYREQYARESYKWKIRQKRYEENNSEKIKAATKASSARRREQLQSSIENYTAQDVLDLLAQQRGRCAEPTCMVSLKPKYHVDHIMPLVLGGSNARDNIQLLCPRCNLAKNRHHPLVWAQMKGRLF